MKVLVTGGMGRIGLVAVRWLIAQGFEVRILDRKSEAQPPPGAEFAEGDINDYKSLREQARGCQAIVHLAAIPTPSGGSPEEVFRVDAGGTFNIFQAAAEAGIRRVVQASSINALGMHYGVQTVEPLYFPVDEEHPPHTTDAYSFSKWVAEEIGEYYYRREGISSVALRFPSVRPPDTAELKEQRQGTTRQMVERLQTMREGDRRSWLEEAQNEVNRLRAQKIMEDREFARSIFSPDSRYPAEVRWLISPHSDFWTVIDERDAAQAIEKGLTAQYEGAHALFVTAAENGAGQESELLARLFFPNVTARKRPLVGRESLVSHEKARRLIGFEPRYSLA